MDNMVQSYLANLTHALTKIEREISEANKFKKIEIELLKQQVEVLRSVNQK